MKTFPYRIVVEWSGEDGVFVARVPALPGCSAHGATPEAATREARRAADAMLDVLREDHSPLPPSDAIADYSGQLRLRLPRSLHEHLSRLAAAEGVSLNQELVSLLSSRSGYPLPPPSESSQARERLGRYSESPRKPRDRRRSNAG